MTDPASQHPYMYCGGNPISYSDPSGHDDILILYGQGRQGYDKNAMDIVRSGGNKVDDEPLESLDQIKEALTKYDYIIIAAHGAIRDPYTDSATCLGI